VQQKDTVIHRNRQLQHRRYGLGQKADFAFENIGAQIQEDGNAHRQQE
jgi:hypothetical protein